MYKYLLLLFCIAVFVPSVYGSPEFNPYKYASPSPEKPFETKIEPVPLKEKYEIPSLSTELQAKADNFTLTQLIDIALQNNPTTKYAWLLAISKAAGWAVKRGGYYPTIDGNVVGDAGSIPQTLGGKSFIQTGLALNYLLLDFGGRSAGVRLAKAALLAANLNHNQAIQDVLRDVPQAYYTYIGNKAMVKAREVNLAEARTSLQAAEQRRQAGVATIADVLESRSNEQQTVYDLANAKGDMDISRGRLATAVGWPANTKFDTAPEPENIPLKEINNDVEELIKMARQNRADLNSARAAVKQKEEDVKQARAVMFPQLLGTGNFQWTRPKDLDFSTNYYGGVNLKIPIFEGFTLRNTLRGAKARLKSALAQLEQKEEGIISEAWTAYHNFKTSKEQLASAKALLASASESYEVSMARYKAGAADIVELMTTQSFLANARSQLITTRMEYYNNYAELIHSVGAEFSASSPEEDER